MQTSGLTWLAALAWLTAGGLVSAQDVDTNAVPVAPAVPTSNAPVAQPVANNLSPESVTAPPATNAAPAAPAAGLVVTTPAAARFDGAMASFNGGQFADAVRAFSDFLRDFPQDRRREEALYRLAESYRQLGRNDDALAAYSYQVQAYPDGPLLLSADLRRGALLFNSGKAADAIAPLQQVADHGDGELQEAAKYLLGRALLATQKEPDGRAQLQSLVDAAPPGKFAGAAAQALAELDDSEAQYPAALALWQKALAAAPDAATQATLAARGGWSALQAGQAATAEKLFQQTRQLDPSGDARKVANTGLLRLLFQQKRYSEWLAVYGPEKDLLLDSAHAEILNALGLVEFTLKHWPEAVAAFDQYLHEFPGADNAVTVAYERFLAIVQTDRARTVSEAEAYLKAWPQSPDRLRVQLLEAQELSRQKKFADALPLWQTLAAAAPPENGGEAWPHQAILLELARAEDELKDWAKAATAYQAYLDDAASQPGAKEKPTKRQIQAQARLAVCLQNDNQLLAATDAWKAVQSEAPAGTSEQQMALESLGLIYARGGPPQESLAMATFRQLLDQFPQSKLRALAAFTIGDESFRSNDYAGAERFLLEARQADPETWNQPATQRLVLGAYGMKNSAQARAYLKQYDAIPAPTDPQARAAARLPAALFYWLAETERQAGSLDLAATFYQRVTQHPDAGDLLPGAWWQLGEIEAHQHGWPAAITSYEKYRDLKPDAKDATVVLLALGRAQLGAQNPAAAQTLGQQALLQEPEGPNSAAARRLLGEAAFAQQNWPEAERMFGTLAVLFDDPKITPAAMARAADAYEKAGDAKSAAQWRQKLAAKYPQYQAEAYP